MARPAVISSANLTDAAVRIVVERGLDAVSVRAVATEAGVSAGAVQHYFNSKDELLSAAYERVMEQVGGRARRLPDREVQPRAYVRALLMELLPLDREREGELRVGIAFSARSVHNPGLAALYAEGYRALVGAVAAALTNALERGEARPRVEPRREAARAVALADGLAWHALCAPGELRATDTVPILDELLEAIFAPEPS